MELLIVGTLEGQIGAASKIAIQQGGHVSIADNEEAGLDVLTLSLTFINLFLRWNRNGLMFWLLPAA